jgi:lysine biosynthesis protein LysW
VNLRLLHPESGDGDQTGNQSKRQQESEQDSRRVRLARHTEGVMGMGKKGTRALAVCPDCSAEIRFRKTPHLGQIVICSSCNTSLEVVSRNPLELDWAFADALEEDGTGDYEYEEVYDDYGEYADYDNWDD